MAKLFQTLRGCLGGTLAPARPLRQATILTALFLPFAARAQAPDSSFYSPVQAGGNLLNQTDVPPGAATAPSAASKPVAFNFIWLEQLDLAKARADGLRPKAALAASGGPISLQSKTYQHGVGMWARTRLTVDLKAKATQFAATVGMDDSCSVSGSVSFEVWLDGRKVADTGIMTSGQPPKTLSISLAQAQKMQLRLENGGDGPNNDGADWADARILLAPGSTESPAAIETPALPPDDAPWPIGLKLEPLPEIAPVGKSPQPAIHGPRLIGSTPGRHFLYRIPATGAGPLAFTAENLPEGLTLDDRTGIISGSIKSKGRTKVRLKATGSAGSTTRLLLIDADAHKQALTPPMGWNSWYVWGGEVSDRKIREAADLLLKTGLAAHGYQYVNIDDCWQGARSEDGRLSGNERFPDMKALGDYIHARGLKFGIYSSPGPKSCAGFEGSYQHEVVDVSTWAAWGVDLLKSDLCGYLTVDSGPTVPARMKAVEVFTRALEQCGRDMVYTFGGWGDTADWGAQAGLNAWRIAGDVTPKWNDIKRVALAQRGHEQQSRPGHWNDADFLMVGNSWFAQNRPSMLTGNEQVLHLTHWSLSASPLFLSCNLDQIDDFTMALLTNDDVIEVDQDPLGKQTIPVNLLGETEVLARPLWDQTQAVGLINWGDTQTTVTVRWSDLRIQGPQNVRDLWRRKELGRFDDSFTATIGRHGAVLLKVGDPKPEQSAIFQ